MQIYSKDRKSLQFPVMCDGYVKIPFGDGSNTPAQGIGIWGHTGEITAEFIITPYETNNHATNNYSGSQKSLSQATKGVAYIPAADRDLLEMSLFYNANMSISLKPLVTGSVTPITPSKYRISFDIKIGGNTTTLTTTDYVIAPEPKNESSTSPTDYLYTNHKPIAKKSSRTVSSVSSTTINLSGSSAEFVVGDNLYTNTGLLIGQIGALGSNALTMSSITNTPSNSTYLYADLPKEPTYVDVPHHIAVSYQSSGLMSIFYNGVEVAKGQHSRGGDFSFANSDIYLGQQASAGNYTTRRRTQFMGEYHEISLTKNARNKFRSMNSLIPQFKNTLLYMDFEEENLDG